MYLKKHNGEILGSDVNIVILRGDAWKYMNEQYEDHSISFIFDTCISLPETVIGWEDAREIDLSSMLDSKALMNQAVNLNLNLMKWRSWPDLDLSGGKKCLLFGAGTLGCAVARNLMGWGFKDIVFIDNGNVSLSNPVRQCLFEYSDCGKPKAICAADALMRIYPDMNAVGHVLSIPMPGHGLAEDLEKIVELVEECDIAFLLTDSRESRWLPIVLCKYFGKMLINVALGFDSYLIDHNFHEDGACYFCNDIVAARNSTRNRTVDQQCSVTRPGLSMMASSQAVEMLVSHLNDVEVPRHVRGSLADFSHKNMKTSRFPNCTACSEMIVDEYKKRNNDFIYDICDNPEQLEKISGITELMKFKEIEEDI
jgi:ubiquitin-like modifier-activating enzyme ATG7